MGSKEAMDRKDASVVFSVTLLLSSAAGQNGNVEIYKPGEELTYNYHSTVLLNEKYGNFKNVGFFTSAKFVVQVIWAQQDQRILELWVQFLDGTSEEIDSSGNCHVEYISTNHQKLTKQIFCFDRNCLSPDLPYLRNPQTALDAIVESSRVIEYEFNHNLQFFKTMKSNEKHVMSVSTNKDFGSQILSEQVLEFDRVTQDKFPVLAGTVDHILNNLIATEELSEEKA
ncbi:hypothetical protein WA026_019269 [Henosepilachna vigintioctopunctata]|uniref:Uncharacterized protein n=1 Tax=Henosepilachna vigintioctopunctata TaxID=420089 RepID=A0AAW1UAF8_9CUCU